MMAYALLLCLGLWSNRLDARHLALTFIVGAGVFLPLPDFSNTPKLFYLSCLAGELCIMLAALRRFDCMGQVITYLSILLCICHVVGFFIGPQPHLSPYRVVVPLLEYAELVTCAITSKPALKLIKDFCYAKR